MSLVGLVILTTACNDEWKDEQYEHYISFKAPLNDNGVTAVYVPFSRHDDNGDLIYGRGISNYLLPVIVSGSTTNGDNISVSVGHSDTLDVLNIERFLYRSDLYYVDMSQYASYPSTVQFKSGEDVALLDIRFDFNNIDMADKWVLPITILPGSGYKAHPRKNYAKAMLRVYPYNNYSGSYAAGTHLMSLSSNPDDAAGGENNRAYAVDEYTVFFYAGNNIDETRPDRKNYKVFYRFNPVKGEGTDNEEGTVDIFAENEDMNFQRLGQAEYTIESTMDEVQPYLKRRATTITNINYTFEDYTLVPGFRRSYLVKGSMTMQRTLNTQIPNEDQAIEW